MRSVTRGVRTVPAPIGRVVLLAWIMILGAITPASAANRPSFEPALRAAIGNAAVPEAAFTRAIKTALWNTNQSAVAITVAARHPTASLVYVLIRRPDGHYRPVDVSPVESGNFGKLGRDRTEYTRFETVPVKWLPRDDGCLQVVIRTRAWDGRKRYTVSEPLVIRADGTPVWR